VNLQGIFTLIAMLWIVAFIVTIWALVDAVRVPTTRCTGPGRN
jgi:hypothetical protein